MLRYKHELMFIFHGFPVFSVYLLICILLLLFHVGYCAFETASFGFFFFVHVDFVMILWTYSKSIFTDPGYVLSDFSGETKRDGMYCMKCRMHRPERTHHCSICDKCVVRMDHHCPWIANCVGIGNTRYFIQFLVYSSIDTIALSGCFAELLLKTQGNSAIWTYFGFISTTGIGIFLVSLAVFHSAAVCTSTSWIEIKVHTGKNPYDQGWISNFTEICGNKPLNYIFPIHN